ncbi:MAG: DNA-directed RNA polymerase subunit alpha [bacterium]
MKFNDLVIPRKLDFIKESLTEDYGRFFAEPFERGFAHTIGNSLRRILLGSLEGAAVTAVKVKGALHEFSTIKGLKEDVISMILNLRQLKMKIFSEGPEMLYLAHKKDGVIRAKEIQSNQNVEILNPDLYLATAQHGADLDLEIEVSRGRGYLPAEKNKKEEHSVGTIPVDAFFSPVKKVYYEVGNARVGQVTDYDRLVIEIWTNGSVSPADALAYAAKIIKDSLSIFINFDEEEVQVKDVPVPKLEEDSKMKDILTQPVDIIELSVRASNCLKIARIKTIGELVRKKDDELLSYKNFGNKSLDEIKERLKELQLSLGMEIR